ncbi:MAG: hypothetical protein C6P35_16070 [Cohnella sp.]|nr:MAG: hypothetical protein C6P35_16070 [Cohnella sp.]
MKDAVDKDRYFAVRLLFFYASYRLEESSCIETAATAPAYCGMERFEVSWKTNNTKCFTCFSREWMTIAAKKTDERKKGGA